MTTYKKNLLLGLILLLIGIILLKVTRPYYEKNLIVFLSAPCIEISTSNPIKLTKSAFKIMQITNDSIIGFSINRIPLTCTKKNIQEYKKTDATNFEDLMVSENSI